jgi:cytochrome c peroxidase
MRMLKLSIVCLFTMMAALPLLQKFLPGFAAAGQSTAALAAPANVTASDNAYTTKVGVTWDAVRGATLYRVLRGTTNDPTTAVSVGTTAAATFFDTTAVAGQTFFYWVRAENGSNLSPLSQPDQGSRSVVNVGPGGVPALNPPPEPPANPVTAAKAYLGKALFWDEQLSSTRTVSCGTCHHAVNGGSDPRTVIGSARARNPGADGQFNTADDVFGSPGVTANNADGTFFLSPLFGLGEQVTGRKSRSYIDAGYSNTLFWDGRATQTFTDPLSGSVVLQTGAALESQAVGPPVNSTEMAHTGRAWNDVVARVSVSKPLALSPSIPSGLENWIAGRSYPELFAEAFGTSDVTPARIAQAIATFERTLFSDQTPFDRSTAGISPLTPEQARGQVIFNGVGRCNTCHAGTLFTDNQFHNIGVRPQAEDPGRFAVTNNLNDLGSFRTPGLRNVGLRAPYFHNGRFATLEDVVDFYNRGGDFNAPNRGIQPIGLTAQQRADLVAFLRGALTDPRVAAGSAPFDRPVLYAESLRVPQVVGTGAPGSGGLVPQVLAVEPPLAGNPNFTVAVSNALGGALAVLVIDSADPGTTPRLPLTGSVARVEVRLSGSAAGAGVGSVSLPIPNGSAFVGATFFGRWYVPDPGAAGGVAVSPAFRMTIFGEAAQSTPNPIDEPQFFVTQHYRDFLSREPDAPGLTGWQNVLNNCPPSGIDANGNRCDRIEVSSDFFRSEEFQTRGYFVYRFFKTLPSVTDPNNPQFGHIPLRKEFVDDFARVSGFLSAQQLEEQKVAFITDFMSRTEFQSRYGPLTDPTNYIKALEQTLGVTLSNESALISGLQNGTETRATVLRKIVESNEVAAKFFNEAFVIMQYFGYLRRDADGQYAQWIQTMNQNGGDYRIMINGFLNSAEYRQRFGP